MIPRYSRPEMVAIWSPETKFRIWFEIEAHACDALAAIGVIPKSAAETIWEKGGNAVFDVARIDEIEAVTKHDVIAFLTHLAEFVGPDSRFIHQGMTSSDVLDTTLNVQLVRATDILLAGVDRVLAALRPAPSNTRTRSVSAAATASMPSRRRWASPSPASMQRWTATRPAFSKPVKKSPPAPFPAPSAPLPISTRASKSMLQQRSA